MYFIRRGATYGCKERLMPGCSVEQLLDHVNSSYSTCARPHLLRGLRRTPRVAFIPMLVLAVVVAAPVKAGSQTSGDSVPGRAAACTPLETRQPNVPDQRPAFPGQTRACAITSDVAFEVVVLAKGLEEPWAVEPLPGGDLLVTEKPGRLRIVSATGETGQPIAGVPAVDARGQGGLLDVALSPAFGARAVSAGVC